MGPDKLKSTRRAAGVIQWTGSSPERDLEEDRTGRSELSEGDEEARSRNGGSSVYRLYLEWRRGSNQRICSTPDRVRGKEEEKNQNGTFTPSVERQFQERRKILGRFCPWDFGGNFMLWDMFCSLRSWGELSCQLSCPVIRHVAASNST